MTTLISMCYNIIRASEVKLLKKKYSLNYNIERDTDRVQAVKDILDTLETDPSPLDLEQMGSYILYGKDQNGYNAVQRGEITNGTTRYANFRRKDDKLLSLDAILDNPLTDQQQFKTTNIRNPYIQKKPMIQRPKYDKKTGELIDPGDSNIPGMVELWESIDRIDYWIHALEGKVPPTEDTLIFDDSYRLYQLKHNLIDLRRHQYYLKDSYQPTLHFQDVDHPKTQFVDWTSDSYYWIDYNEWEKRTSNALTHHISPNLTDYETRINETTGKTEVKWVVREHTFDWENPLHIRALINNYDLLYNYLYERLDTYGRTLIFDFERYRELAHLSEVRDFLLTKKIEHLSYTQILEQLQIRFGLKYNENHLSTIYSKEIPEKIAETAKKMRMLIDTPDSERKKCHICGRALPRDSLFFSRNRSRNDGFASNCKECEKLRRIQKGGQPKYDKRSKESALFKMQTI